MLAALGEALGEAFGEAFAPVFATCPLTEGFTELFLGETEALTGTTPLFGAASISAL